MMAADIATCELVKLPKERTKTKKGKPIVEHPVLNGLEF